MCDQLLQELERDFKDAKCSAVASWSQDDRHAMSILNRTVKKIEGHYSVGLLRKTEELDLPNNRALAKKRLKSLMRKFRKNSNLFKHYSEKMSECINNYAEPVSEMCAVVKKVNYIPHHCTSKSVKFRIVFDCYARTNGKCLNDQLLRGPDLINNLVGVVLRQYPFVVVGDIKGMFSQMLVAARMIETHFDSCGLRSTI